MKDIYHQLLNEAHTFSSQEKAHSIFGLPEDCSYLEKNFLKDAPNYHLFFKNILYEESKDDYLYLAHITVHKKNIVKEKKILCSSGCLVGSVYCVPVYKKNKSEQFTLHNMGEYIFSKEISFFADKKTKPEILLFEIKNKSEQKRAGLNYLKLGKFHLAVFEELRFLLNNRESDELEHQVTTSINESKNLLFVINRYSQNEIESFFDKFFSLYTETTKHVPIFGYFLFEIVSEFMVLYQTDDKSKILSAEGEINVENFKKIVFSIIPGINKKFDLGFFHPNLKDLKEYIDNMGLDFELFKKHFIKSLNFYVKTYLFSGEIEKSFFDVNTDFNHYKEICPNFVGHVIHRIVRKMARYPDFYVSFDTFKAIKIWNFWNKNSILFPYNSIIPKGEIGINPAFPDLEYKIYSTRIIDGKRNNKITLQKHEELNIKIVPQLISINNLLMRKKI